MFNSQKIKASDVIEVEGALRALIRAEYPSVTVEVGSALNDLVIKSLGYLAAAIKSEADQVKARLYLAELESSTDSDSQTLLEDLASNFLVSVDEAPPQRGIVSFSFSSSTSRVIPASIIVTQRGNNVAAKLYDTSQDITLVAGDYIAIGQGDSTEYVYSVLMETIMNSDSISILPGEFQSSVSFTGLNKVYTDSKFVGISPTEFTRSSLVDRMHYAQTLRGFHSRNSIQATLLNEGIANLKKAVGIGAGDAEMARDIIPDTLSSSRFHSLGMVNVVIASTVELSNAVLDPQNVVSPAQPILAIAKVVRDGTVLDMVSDFSTARYVKSYDSETKKTSIVASVIDSGAALQAGGVKVYVDDESERLLPGSSTAGKFTITSSVDEEGPSTLQLWVDKNVPIVQALIESDNYNTLGSSTKCLAAALVRVIIPTVKVRPLRGVGSASINTHAIKRAITDSVNNWNEAYALPVSDLVSTIMLTFGGLLSSATFTTGIQYIVHLPDGRHLGYTSTDRLSVEATEYQLIPSSLSVEDLNALQVSDRLVNYTITSDDISVEVLDV